MKKQLSRILSIVLCLGLLLAGLPVLGASASTETLESAYPVGLLLSNFNGPVSGWHGPSADGGATCDTANGYLHLTAVSGRQSSWGSAVANFSLTTLFEDKSEIALSIWGYAESLDSDKDIVVNLKDGADNTVSATLQKANWVTKANTWCELVVPLTAFQGTFLWESGLKQWSVARTGGTADFYIDQISLVKIPYSGYRVKQVLADDSVKVSGGLENTTRAISGSQSYYFHSESTSQKPVVYGAPIINLSTFADSLTDLAISFFAYTDSLSVDGQYALEIASGGNWDNVFRVMGYTKKSSFLSQNGAWEQVVIPFTQEMATAAFDWTNMTQWRLRLQVPSADGSATTPDTLWVDKIEIVTLEETMEVAPGEYEVLDVLEDAEKDGLTLTSAKVETEKVYSGSRSVALTAKAAQSASVSRDFAQAVDVKSMADKTGLSVRLACETVANGSAKLTLRSAGGSLDITNNLNKITKTKVWQQIPFLPEQGTATGTFDLSAVTGWTLTVTNTDTAKDLVVYADELSVIRVPVNPYPVKKVLADFDSASASFTQGSLDGEHRRSGLYAAKLAAEAGTGNAAIYKGESIRLSDYADQIEKLAISFWVYADTVGEDVDMCVQFASESSWANTITTSYVLKDCYAPTVGKWHQVVIRLADMKPTDTFDWNKVTAWRIFQHNSGTKPAWNLWVDDIELVEVPLWNGWGETPNLIHYINGCDSSKMGASNGGSSPVTYVRAPRSMRLAIGDIGSSTWYAPGATVNLSSVFYDFEDLALSVWVRADSAENDADLTFNVWSDGGNQNSNVLKWSMEKKDVLETRDEWVRLLLKFSEATQVGNFDPSQYKGFSVQTTPKGTTRSSLYVDEPEIVSLKEFGAMNFMSVEADKTAAKVGDSIQVTVTVDNTLEKDLQDIQLNLLYHELMLTAQQSDDFRQTLDLAQGEKKTFTYNFLAEEGGAAVFTLRLNAGGATMLAQARTDITGRGFYLGDGHTHSTRSDGTNTLQENFQAVYDRGHSFILATDHNADPAYKGDVAEALEEVRQGMANPDGFIALKNNEITQTPGGHSLEYNTKTQHQPQATAAGYQSEIADINAEGGMFFLAHPYYEPWIYPGLESTSSVIPEYAGTTGFEIVNGSVAMSEGNTLARQLWDRYNISGWDRYWGVVNSDGHTKDQVGSVFNGLLMDSLTEENIYDAYEKGRFYGSTGPQIRLTLGGADMGGTAYLAGESGEVELNLTAYTQNDAILSKVIAYRYAISDTVEGIEAAYQAGQNAPIVLYEQGEGEALTRLEIQEALSVSAGEFIRVEVYAMRGTNTQVAFSNPIWVETADEDTLKDLEKAQAVTDAINALPQEITLTDKEAVESARTAYDALTDAQKALVGNVEKLTAAEKAIADLEEAAEKAEADQAAADEVITLIEALPLPEEMDWEDRADVSDARAAYDALTEEQKALVPKEIYDKLVELEGIVWIEPPHQGIKDLLDALPEEITLADKEAVEAIRAFYDTLTDDQKAWIDDESLEKFFAAEEAIKALEEAATKEEADKAAAQAVTDAINALTEESTEEEVTAVCAAYEALTEAQKALVAQETMDKLVALVEKFQPVAITYGDADGNGTVDAADALKALQHAVKLTTLEGNGATAANVNGDDKIDATDALLMLQYTVKLIDSFPVEVA